MMVWPKRQPRSSLGIRLSHAITDEEQRGLVFAFRARVIAVIAVMLWLVLLIEPQRQLYYLSVSFVLLLLGAIPHLLRHHRHAVPIRLAFVLLDAILITAVIVLTPPGDIDSGFPIQMRVRGPEFLYLMLLIVGAALSYSPLQVIWTGFCVVMAWGIGVFLVQMRADTRQYDPAAEASPEAILRLVTDPYFVGYFNLMNQLVLAIIATAILAAAVWRSRRMLLRQTRAEIARADLARYVSPDVADAIIASDRTFGVPTTRDVAVLFADIVGFTALSERLPPDRVVRLLKSFHERGSRVVFRHGGTLDKYMGDGFLATFGTISDAPDAAALAVRCAIDLQHELERWNAKRAMRGADTIRLSTGVHCGPVVVGNIGSDRRLEFSVVGDAVNIASRLETLTRRLGCRIAVSADCLATAQKHVADLPAFASAGIVQLDGREQSVAVWVWPADRQAEPAKA
ncbi:MAG: adenylate/guanylate cyclase domain-containing protein [Ferrovibrio sp.]|uniref:adenylate/guanylate cyclase domain-containing protein n=1 Tax=Ferrovibrio sp. TaxID=1917215 RepID=UPI00391AD57A